MALPWFLEQFKQMGYEEANEIFRLLCLPENKRAWIVASRNSESREELVVAAKRLFNIKIEKDPTKNEADEEKKWYDGINASIQAMKTGRVD